MSRNTTVFLHQTPLVTNISYPYLANGRPCHLHHEQSLVDDEALTYSRRLEDELVGGNLCERVGGLLRAPHRPHEAARLLHLGQVAEVDDVRQVGEHVAHVHRLLALGTQAGRDGDVRDRRLRWVHCNAVSENCFHDLNSQNKFSLHRSVGKLTAFWSRFAQALYSP